MRLPNWVGHWPAIVGFLMVSYVLLADPAPSDPDRLAQMVLVWLAMNMGLTWIFGPRWLVRGEPITVLMRLVGLVSMFNTGRIGILGWKLVGRNAPFGLAVLSVISLGIGSFDGLNETFWWLRQLGLNPFEYPGRSGVIAQTVTGMFAAIFSLLLAFVTTLWIGSRLVNNGPSLRTAFCALAPTLLPIALGYHVAHYFTSFLVDGQYALVALSDPFMTGADILRLGEFYVTTGFFNTQDSVRVIYLTQAAAVVVGHVIAVLTAHSVALRLYGGHRAAVLSQIPLALFMIAYTWFGLWLLASPRF